MPEKQRPHAEMDGFPRDARRQWRPQVPRADFLKMNAKGFDVSDERIREEVLARLDDGDLDASEIVVEVARGEVTLSGKVSDRASKQMAQAIVHPLRGVRHCNNRVLIGNVVKDGFGWGEDWESHTEWTSGVTRGASPTPPDSEGECDHRRMR